MVPLGRKTLFEDLPRFLVAQAGVAFAVALIAIQTGIFIGFVKSAGLPVDESTADVWVAAKDMLYFELAAPIAYENLDEARHVQGVARAEALFLKTSAWLGPAHKIEYIRVIGFDPQGELFVPGPIPRAALAKLQSADTAIVDAGNLKALNIPDVGGYGKIGHHNVRVVALTRGTQPIISATFIYTSLANAKAYFAPATPPLNDFAGPLNPRYAAMLLAIHERAGSGQMAQTLDPSDDINYVLVRAKPGVNLADLKYRLDSALPGTRSYTKQEMADRTRSYWRQRTGIGFLLGLVAAVGFVVGMTVVGQILYTSVSEHIKEYGTLRAMGAPDALFYRIVGEQAVLMALLGFLPGIALSVWVSWWAHAQRNILILITPASAAGVLVVIVAMCVVSGIFAVQRALRVDPAIVFKA
ncbi:MAG TPA: FtsX-like permease family protein [Candidatus Acidoferrales bacterium]|nr:FtsX-like permease family protein [Candidatus Acidoferrales bacterium]